MSTAVKQALITLGTVIVALVIYEKWISPMINVKLDLAKAA
jgi:hypothetical protein